MFELAKPAAVVPERDEHVHYSRVIDISLPEFVAFILL
jgi:hypothetical protein